MVPIRSHFRDGAGDDVILQPFLQIDKVVAVPAYAHDEVAVIFGMYLGGMRYKEIAQSCGLDVKSVDNALLRAKRKIKKRAENGSF